MKAKVFCLFVILFSVLVICGTCNQSKVGWQGTIEEIDGVPFVKNPKEPLYRDDILNLEEELSISGAEGRKENEFFNITSVAVDEHENIYILDSSSVNIQIFDENGTYLKTIGKRGQGPGELQFPIQLQITDEKEIAVFERFSMSFFSLDGKYLRKTPLTKISRPIQLIMDEDGKYVCKIFIVEEEPKRAVVKFDPGLEKVITIAKLDPPPINPFRSFSFEILKPDLFFALTKENGVVWAQSAEYEIFITSPDGKLIRKISKDYDPVRISEEGKEEIIFERYGRETPSRVNNANFPKYFFPIKGLSADENGYIFVCTFEKGQEKNSHIYDVFEPQGQFITRIPLKPMPNTLLFWKKNKLYTIEEDEEGYQYVKRYKVSWKI